MTDKYRDGDILKEILAHNNPNTYKQKIIEYDRQRTDKSYYQAVR